MARLFGRTNINRLESRSHLRIRALIGFGLLMVIIILAGMLFRRYGQALASLASAQDLPSAASNPFLRVLIVLTAIVILGQFLGRLFASWGQPPVIGEVLAGILLGPSLLGPQISALILPGSVAPFLNVIGQLGVVLYMFLVGLEFNPGLLSQRAKATIAISYSGILSPFLLGAGLALLLYPSLSSHAVPVANFALFMGLAMSITAFPVLARIITDYGLAHTRLGAIALSSAAVDDVTAWCLLALVVGIANAQGGAGLLVAIGAVVFVVLMFLLVSPALAWVTRRWGGDQQPRTAIALIFIALLLAALIAEAIGIHAIFGAFLLGVIIPHNSAPAGTLKEQLVPVVTVLLLPAFFAFTGMRTRIDLLSSPVDWLICGLIILVAMLGKFGGCFAAARLTGLGWRNAAMLGALMNTRGLMELIVLNVGLELRIISPTLFSMMVVMALVTTALTAPLLHLFRGMRNPTGMPDLLDEDPPPYEAEAVSRLAESSLAHESQDNEMRL